MIYEKDNLSDEQNLAWCEDIYVKRNQNSLDFIKAHPQIPALFIHYDDLVDRKLDHVISRFVGKELNYSFVNPKKRRSKPLSLSISNEALNLYEEMLTMYRQNIFDTIVNSSPILPKQTLNRLPSELYRFYKKVYRHLK